jgi:hypothetical protein
LPSVESGRAVIVETIHASNYAHRAVQAATSRLIISWGRYRSGDFTKSASLSAW